MEFDSVIKKRKSTRNFKSKKVSWSSALEAISTSLEGPFSGNNNNLKFLIIEDKKTIKLVSQHAQQSWIQYSPLLIVVCSDETHQERVYGERGRVYSRQQAGAAINTILLKLTDLKISSCWIGSYSDEIIKQNLEIPQHIQIEAIIATGYEDKSNSDKKPKKKNLESAIAWENWKTKKRPTLFEESKKNTETDFP